MNQAEKNIPFSLPGFVDNGLVWKVGHEARFAERPIAFDMTEHTFFYIPADIEDCLVFTFKGCFYLGLHFFKYRIGVYLSLNCT